MRLVCPTRPPDTSDKTIPLLVRRLHDDGAPTPPFGTNLRRSLVRSSYYRVGDSGYHHVFPTHVRIATAGARNLRIRVPAPASASQDREVCSQPIISCASRETLGIPSSITPGTAKRQPTTPFAPIASAATARTTRDFRSRTARVASGGSPDDPRAVRDRLRNAEIQPTARLRSRPDGHEKQGRGHDHCPCGGTVEPDRKVQTNQRT